MATKLNGKSKMFGIFSKKRQLPCKIYESYQAKPDIYARKIIENLLLEIPQEHLHGLGSVIICDSISYKEHYETEEVPYGSYNHPIDKETLPWIEICIDKIITPLGFLANIHCIRDMEICRTLYHEIGHHIERMKQTDHTQVDKTQSEESAKKWSTKLGRHYMRRRYWYVYLLLTPLIPLRKYIEKLAK